MVTRLLQPLALILMLILTAMFPASAQDEAPWTAILFNPAPDTIYAGSLVAIGEDGVLAEVEVPQAVFDLARAEGEDTTFTLSASPDLRFLAVTYFLADGSAYPRLFNLADGSMAEVSVAGDPEYIEAMDFSPDGSLVAAVYYNAADPLNVGGLLAIDAATGEIASQLTTAEINAATGTEADSVFINIWAAEGLRFGQACFVCDFDNQPLWVWDVTSGEIREHGSFLASRGSMLNLTGEILMTRRSEDYPIVEDPNMPGQSRNVVEYLPAGQNPQEAGTVIYFDESLLPIGTAQWGVDGKAFMIRQQNGSRAYVVTRDGSRIEIAVPEGPMIALGTSTGWLMVDGLGTVYHHRMSDGEMTYKTLTTLNFSADYGIRELSSGGMAYRTRIGTTAGDAVFPAVAAP